MRIRAAAYAVITRDDEILLAHWRSGPMHGWTLPGGGLEAGEHPEDAAVREVLEETGFDVELTGLLGVDSAVPSGQDPSDAMQALRIIYTAAIVGGRLANELDGSTDEAAWHRIDDVPELRHVAMVDMALDLLEALEALDG